MEYKIELMDRAAIRKADPRQFRSDLKRVFDASIPWDDPRYDDSFQDHYLELATTAVFVRDQDGTPISLAIGSVDQAGPRRVIYLAGIWVDTAHKSRGLGKLAIGTFIEQSASSIDDVKRENIYIALRTQNAQIYEYFERNYDIYPHPDKAPTPDVLTVGAFVHQKYSPSKPYEPENMIIRGVFPSGIIVGHVHFSRRADIDRFIFERLDVQGGDSYILVASYDSQKTR